MHNIIRSCSLSVMLMCYEYTICILCIAFAHYSGCVVAPIFPRSLSPLCLSPAPSGTQHAPRVNTNKQCLPSLLPLPVHPREFMWDGLIASLRSIVSIAPRRTSQTKRKHASEMFTLSLYTGLLFVFYLEQRGITQYPPLYLEGLYNLFFYYIWGELKMTHSRISIHRQLVPTVCTLI